jgi:hypothetical protein
MNKSWSTIEFTSQICVYKQGGVKNKQPQLTRLNNSHIVRERYAIVYYIIQSPGGIFVVVWFLRAMQVYQ